jgi:hypothetical protein
VTSKPRKLNLAWSAALAVMLGIGYVLGYPIALRVCATGRNPPEIRAYAPIEALVLRNEFSFYAMYEWAFCVGADDLYLTRVWTLQIQGAS